MLFDFQIRFSGMDQRDMKWCKVFFASLPLEKYLEFLDEKLLLSYTSFHTENEILYVERFPCYLPLRTFLFIAFNRKL